MHAVWTYLQLIDPLAVALVVGLALLSGLAGYEICQARHKQHGIGVDPWEYLIPDDPRDLVPGHLSPAPKEPAASERA